MPYRDPEKRRARRNERYRTDPVYREKVLSRVRARDSQPELKLKKLEYNSAYYHAHREQFLADNKQYRKDHPQLRTEESRRYAKRHPEKVRANALRYRQRHPERLKAHDRHWAEQNPEKVRARNDRRRARLAGVLHTLTARQWDAILAFYENRCAYCGRDDVPMTRDHVVPIIRGGGHVAENVVPACLSCNSKKGPKTPEEWRN